MGETIKMEREDKIYYLFVVGFLIGIFVIGWLSNDFYRDYSNERTYDGLNIRGNMNHSNAIEVATEYDKYGDWVCVNIKGMSYGEAENTCNHECMHSAFSEIISEQCEKDFNRCGELLDNWSLKNE
jgi:hypothetical protein